MRKKKVRRVAQLYKRTVKLSKPRITPILEGNCRIQGPLDESESDFETDTMCSMGDRSLEASLVEHVDCSVSNDAAKNYSNDEQDYNNHNTGDTLLVEKKITAKNSSNKHIAHKSATKDFVEREEMPGSKKTRSNVRRAKGNRTRKTVISTHSDFDRKAEIQSSSPTEQNENFLESPSASQANYKKYIHSLGIQSEEIHEKGFVKDSTYVSESHEAPIRADTKTCHYDRETKEQEEAEEEFPTTTPNNASNDNCCVKEHVDVSESHETPDNADINMCHYERNTKEEEEPKKQLPPTKPNDASNIDSRNFCSVETSTKSNMEQMIVLDELNKSKDSLAVAMPFHSLKGFDSDIYVAGRENSAEMPSIPVDVHGSESSTVMSSIPVDVHESESSTVMSSIPVDESSAGMPVIPIDVDVHGSESSAGMPVIPIDVDVHGTESSAGMPVIPIDDDVHGSESSAGMPVIPIDVDVHGNESSAGMPGIPIDVDVHRSESSAGMPGIAIDVDSHRSENSAGMPQIPIDVDVHRIENSAGMPEIPIDVKVHRSENSAGMPGIPIDVDVHRSESSADMPEIPVNVNVSENSAGMPIDVSVHESENSAGMPGNHFEVHRSENSAGMQGIPVDMHGSENSAEMQGIVDGSENRAGMPGVPVNGEASNNKDLKESPLINKSSNVENANDQTAALSESFLAANVFLKGTCRSLGMTNAEKASISGLPSKIHSEKAASGLTKDFADVSQLNDNIQTGISTNMFANNSFPGPGLAVNAAEAVDLSIDYGALDNSSSSSPDKDTSQKVISEKNNLPEAIHSFPISLTPGHSSITSSSQSVILAKEIEVHTSCQQDEDLDFTCSTKKSIIADNEAKDASPVLPANVSVSPEHHKNDNLKRSELVQDFHIGEANMRVGLSELARPLGVTHPCEVTEKSCEPHHVEEDVKVCDICGDNGYEECLAICRICKDGAEHIYCMQTMLDEVPEGDWVCEGCKLKQNVDVKRVDTPLSFTVAPKPACLTSRKQKFYGTARSRLSAKLDKKKLVPERKRALKGSPSSELSTKRQAESSEFGPAPKKMALGTSNTNIGSSSPKAKSSFARENSFKALDIEKVKTPVVLSSTGNLSGSSLHDSCKSSTLHGSSSPRPSANVQSSKNRLSSATVKMTDSLLVTGMSKVGSNAQSSVQATSTGKMSNDVTSLPSAPLRLNSLQKLSATPKVIKDSVEVGQETKADRENTSSSHASGGIAKSMKCNINRDSLSILERRTASVHSLETKEIRTGKIAKDEQGHSRKKLMAKSESMVREHISAGAANLEKLVVDDRNAKPLTVLRKDSSKLKPAWSEEKMTPSMQMAPNSNKAHSSLRLSAVGRTQSKASPSKLQGVVKPNKLQQSTSTQAFHRVAAEKLESSLLETTSGIKSIAEANTFSSSIKDDKKSSSSPGDKLVAEGYASQHDKRSGNLENKPASNDYLHEENRKAGNFKKYSSLKCSLPHHLPAIGSTRCYKCKELGHSAQSCTNCSFGEAGSRHVSSLITSTAIDSGNMPDTVGGKSSTAQDMTPSGNHQAYVNDQSSEQSLQVFDSDKPDHVQQPGSGLLRQVSSNKEISHAGINSNFMQSSNETTDLNRKLEMKTSESCHMHFGGESSNVAQIPTSVVLKSSLINHNSTNSKTEEEKMSHAETNESKKTGVADGQRFFSKKRLSEGEASFHPRDSGHVTTVIAGHSFGPVEDSVVGVREDSVVGIRGNASYGVISALDGTGQTSTELRAVSCRQSSQVETTKATSLPEHNFLWQGGFEVKSREHGTNYFDGIQAHASTSAASKVLDAAKKFSSKLKLKEVPRCSSWPTQFQYCCPSDKDIALYFFAKDPESYERPYRKLLEHMIKNDFALRGNLDGVDLLVFPSNRLAEKSQRWNRLFFLWGVFKERKSSCIESSISKHDNVQEDSAKRDTLGSINLNGNDSPRVHPRSSVLGISAIEDMDTDRAGDGESNTSEGIGRAVGDQFLASVSSHAEVMTDNCHDSSIPTSFVVEDGKVHNTQKIDEKVAEQLSAKKHSVGSSVESNEQPYSKSPHFNRLNNPDLPFGFETNTTCEPHNARDDMICQKFITSEAGLLGLGKRGEVSSSYAASQTERKKPNNLRHGVSALSANSLSCTETKSHSCDTFKIGHLDSDSPFQQANTDNRNKRLRDSEYNRQTKRTKAMESARFSCKDDEMDPDSMQERKHQCPSPYLSPPQLLAQLDPDSMQERKRHCPSPYLSPPQLVQSSSPIRQIYNYDCQYSRSHSPDLDPIKHQQPSLGWHGPETNSELVRSSHEKSSNNIAADGKEGQRRLNKTCGEVRGRENGKELVANIARFIEPKVSSVPTYHIADLNQVADVDSAVEFSGTPLEYIQPKSPEGYLHFPQDSQVRERVFLSCSDNISKDQKLSKLSEQWPLHLSFKQNFSEPSSAIQLISSTEEKQELLDLNKPSLELALGGKTTSSNPETLPDFVQLHDQTSSQLPAGPIKSNSVQGVENGSSLALSLAFPLSQSNQTAKTPKEDYTKPVNCSVNTSFFLFGHRVNG